MKTSRSFLFLLLALLIIGSISWVPGNCETEPETTFDKENNLSIVVVPPNQRPALNHIEAVFTWTPTLCLTGNCITRSETFSFHGAWPADSTGTTLPGPCGPTVNDVTRDFSRPFQNQLAVAWPSNTVGVTNAQFWTHEWNYHGTCSGKAVLPYFQYGLQVAADRTKLLDILNNAGYPPSTTTFYTRTQIVEAIATGLEAQYRNNVYISCKQNNNQNMLYEVYVCHSLNTGAYIGCPINTDLKGCRMQSGREPQILIPKLS